MCRSLDQEVLLSSPFASSAEACSPRLVYVRRVSLRGVGQPQHLFTLDPGEVGNFIP